MKLEDLQHLVRTGKCPEPEILSLEGMTYIVRHDDELLEEDGTTLQFRSAHAAGRLLASAGLDRGWLVHSSPYDEMIGRDEAQPPPPLRIAIQFGQV